MIGSSETLIQLRLSLERAYIPMYIRLAERKCRARILNPKASRRPVPDEITTVTAPVPNCRQLLPIVGLTLCSDQLQFAARSRASSLVVVQIRYARAALLFLSLSLSLHSPLEYN